MRCFIKGWAPSIQIILIVPSFLCSPMLPVEPTSATNLVSQIALFLIHYARRHTADGMYKSGNAALDNATAIITDPEVKKVLSAKEKDVFFTTVDMLSIFARQSSMLTIGLDCTSSDQKLKTWWRNGCQPFHPPCDVTSQSGLRHVRKSTKTYWYKSVMRNIYATGSYNSYRKLLKRRSGNMNLG